MRVSLAIFFCLLFAVVHSATTKAPARKSAYAYLRSIRGKSSCANGTCPFWQQHGRSFLSLRCYSEQYQECVCLHRMCFSSCLFDRNTCNNEMVSCLKQICPRCSPASPSPMCGVHDSMAVRVTETLSTFVCYPCCPNANKPTNSNTSNIISHIFVDKHRRVVFLCSRSTWDHHHP